MVWESKFWKAPLLDLVSQIEVWESKINWTEAELADIEREIMIGFYSIRKLSQSFKLSDRTLDENLKVSIYPNTNRVTLINRYYINETFDLEAPNHTRLNIKFISNQIIHSYLFLIEETELGGLSGIFFSSDHKKNESLYLLKTREIKRILKIVANDYPASGKGIYNKEKEDYDISLS